MPQSRPFPPTALEPGAAFDRREFGLSPARFLAYAILAALFVGQLPITNNTSGEPEVVLLDLEVSVQASGVGLLISEGDSARRSATNGVIGEISTVLEDGHQLWVASTGERPSDRILGRAARALVKRAGTDRGSPRPHVRIWIRGSEGVAWTDVQDVGRALEYGLGRHGAEPSAASVQLAVDARRRTAP